MRRTALGLSLLAAALLQPALSLASDRTFETAHLIVSDSTGRLSDEQLRGFAGRTQGTLEKVLAFWSANPGVERLGKIRVIVDVPRRDVYSCVFYWDRAGDRRVRTVRVYGADGAPQMLAHKLTSAVFPQKDKLIRNLMGILTEAQVGNPLTFPMCGLGSDEWVSALLGSKAYIPLGELGPDHESWGMSEAGGGKLSIHDKPRQHKAYAEAGSFGSYLLATYGITRLKQLQRLSQGKDRPFRAAFGLGLEELEAAWLEHLKTAGRLSTSNVSTAARLLERNPATACSEAQQRAAGKK